MSLLLVYATFFGTQMLLEKSANSHLICHGTRSYTFIYWLSCDHFVCMCTNDKNWHPKWSHTSERP